MDNKKFYRQAIGEKLREFRESRGLTMYRIAKTGDMEHTQVQSVESGDTNYTIDTFFSYLRGCYLYVYFAEKSETAAKPHDLEDLVKKSKLPE